MRCPSLQELPPPPPDRIGWPWTEESARAPELCEGKPWPKISIITPSYMQGEFLEHTIRSVLLQGYPDIEYFILDGGSTDESRAIIQKYEPWLAGWRCEKDGGQAATVNEGWARTTGAILAWINSDDWYHPRAFVNVAERYCSADADWIAGPIDDCDAEGQPLRRHPAWHTPLAQTLGYREFGYFQPGMFWSRKLVEQVGNLDEAMHCCFDLDFWARSLVAGYTLSPLDTPVACFRQHGTSKSTRRTETTMRESWEIFRRYSKQLSPQRRKKAAHWLRDYEADSLLRIVYRRLEEKRRLAALGYILARPRMATHLHPRRLLWGALFRILVTGRPPDWFKD